MKESGDIAQAQERQREAETELKEIQTELEQEVQELQGAAPDAAIETTEVKARKTGVDVRLVALVWKPVD